MSARPIRFIAEFGSCHMGKMAPIYEAILLCKKYGIDALKLQLFPPTQHYLESGNVWLSHPMFEEAYQFAKEQEVPLSASVFSLQDLEFLLKFDVPFIKLAYSKKHCLEWIDLIKKKRQTEIIVSTDVLHDGKLPAGVTKLYCIPAYPVPYLCDFTDLFPRFDGFSSHCMGTFQTERAIQAGAKIIEQHVRLGSPEETCPDAQFAVLLEDFGRLARRY